MSEEKKMRKTIAYCALALVISMLVSSCSKPVPKPYSYFRIDLPEHEYTVLDTAPLPFTLERAKISNVTYNGVRGENNQWFDLVYERLNARVYCNYSPVKGNLRQLSEDSRSLVYKHTVRADAIIEQNFDNEEANTHAILYRITGNAASPLQFVVTDSTRHFLRGSVYFNNTPNADSIAPVERFVEEDVTHLIETLKWKD